MDIASLNNPHKYYIETYGDGTAFIEDEAGNLGCKVDEADIEDVIMYLWESDDNGYFRPVGKNKLYLANFLLDVPTEEEVVFIGNNGNKFSDYTKANLQAASKRPEVPSQTLLVEGHDVIVDAEDYYTMDLYNYNWKIYQGYIVRLEKRKRVFLHKQIMAEHVPNDVHVRYRFRDKDKFNCTKANIRIDLPY